MSCSNNNINIGAVVCGNLDFIPKEPKMYLIHPKDIESITTGKDGITQVIKLKPGAKISIKK